MFETDAELAALQRLLDESFAQSSEHLLSIMEPQRRLSAERLGAELPSPAVLNVATVTANGEPRVSAVDGHFLHGRWYFTTATEAYKAIHLTSRPAVSASFTPIDGYGVFCHGQAAFVEGAEKDSVIEHIAGVYGVDAQEWGAYPCLRIDPHWMTGFAMTDEEMAQIEATRLRRDESS